jgi:hypothetical protein
VEKHRELVEDERGACSEDGRQNRDPELAWLEREREASCDQA